MKRAFTAMLRRNLLRAFMLARLSSSFRSAAVLFALVSCNAVSVNEVARHKEWMDAAQDLTYDLKDALDGKSSEKAAEPAAKLIKLGEQEEEYWKKAKLDDIAELAQQSLKVSRQIASEAKDAKFDLAILDYGRLQTSCRSCHDLHPENRVKVER